MFGASRLMANVVAPAKPRVAMEDILDLLEGSDGFLAGAFACVINPHIDEGIRFSLENMVLAGDFHTVPIVLECTAEIPEFAVNPSDAVG